jgi:uncharacterized protein (DUF1786 family)
MKRRAVGGTGGDHSGRHHRYEIEGFKEELVKSMSVKSWSANARDVLRKITRVTAAFTKCLGKATGEYASWITQHITVAANKKFG